MEPPPLHERHSFSQINGVMDVKMTPRTADIPNTDYRHRSVYGYPMGYTGQERPTRSVHFDSSLPLFSGDWSDADQGSFIAVGTYNEEAQNRIHILTASQDSQRNPTAFTNVADALVTLPQTKISWDPAGISSEGKLRLLSTGDCLRPWSLDLNQGNLEALAPLSKKPKGVAAGVQPAPLTSFDWNAADPNLVITSSIDTTCTLWDLAMGNVRTQLIAHDSDVYDVAFLAQSPHKFVSVGADGSARLFDLRSLDNSTIIFELATPVPLLRVETNPTDAYLLTVIAQDSPLIYVVDIRATRNPVNVLQGHQAAVNCAKWAPSQVGRNILVSGSDDCQMLIWDLSSVDQEPLIGAFTDSAQVNNVLWSPNGNWLSSISGKTIQGVRYR